MSCWNNDCKFGLSSYNYVLESSKPNMAKAKYLSRDFNIG